MPVYQYICTECGKEYELLRKEPPINELCICLGTLKRIWNTPEFKIKGHSYKNGYNHLKEGLYETKGSD